MRNFEKKGSFFFYNTFYIVPASWEKNEKLQTSTQTRAQVICLRGLSRFLRQIAWSQTFALVNAA